MPRLDLDNCILIFEHCFFSVTRRSGSDIGHILTYSVSVSTDLTYVTLVSDDTYWRLDWCYSEVVEDGEDDDDDEDKVYPHSFPPLISLLKMVVDQ